MLCIIFQEKLAGHADIKTTMGYAHLTPDSLRNAVQSVFGAVNDRI